MQAIKVAIVGDARVGKTSLMLSYTTKEEAPTETNIDGNHYTIELCDVGGAEDYVRHRSSIFLSADRVRPLSYHQADVILCCFSIGDPASLEHVHAKWLPEAKYEAPHTPIVLVGTKMDLREDSGTIEELAVKKRAPVCFEQGLQTAQEIGAVKYMECSAFHRIGIEAVFEEAIRVAISAPPKPQPKKRRDPNRGGCTLV